MELDEHDLFDSGLNRFDWYMLRDSLISASWSSDTRYDDFERLPERLKNHAIGVIIANNLAGRPNGDLDNAATMMVGGADKAWLILEKS